MTLFLIITVLTLEFSTLFYNWWKYGRVRW